MNYTKHYNLLILRGQNRILDGYVEKHHIIPKCLGGTNDKDNIVVLTPEEHFLAHQLLVKIYPGNRDLIYAAQMMTQSQTGKRNNNKLFGWLRRQMALAMSIQTKNWQVIHGHPKGMLGKKQTDITKQKIANSSKSRELLGINVYAYNLDGTFFKKFETITDCAINLLTSPSNIKYTADGNFAHCKGKQLKYQYYEKIEPYVRPTVKTYIRTDKQKKNISNNTKNNKATCKHCGIITTQPNIVRWHNDNCKKNHRLTFKNRIL